nr:retrovirus-related Pol polyprotein from transposon TNT 1-94 [Tanacetum cinerariifolium]
TIVYADSDHMGDYVDHKSTSGVCTFIGCCLTSWFSKKQTALTISTTEAEYVSVGKAFQQDLWMKQALIYYDIKLDDVPVLCDNKESIAENLLPIPSKCEVTLEDKMECDLPISENSPVCNDNSNSFSDSKIDDDISVYDDDFEDIEYVEASLPDPEIVSIEMENGAEEENVEEEERLINLMKNDIFDSSNDPLLEEADLFLSDNSIPPGIENVADDLEGEIFDNPSTPRPPPESLDAETDAGEEIAVVMNVKDEFDEDFHFFMFDKVFSLLSAESEDTIFDPGISD